MSENKYGLAARNGVYHLAHYPTDAFPRAKCNFKLLLLVVDRLSKMERARPPLRFCKRCAKYDVIDPDIEVFFA